MCKNQDTRQIYLCIYLLYEYIYPLILKYFFKLIIVLLRLNISFFLIVDFIQFSEINTELILVK